MGSLLCLGVLGRVISNSVKYQRAYGFLEPSTLSGMFAGAFAILLGIGYWYNWWGTAKRFPEGCCQRCGYDLRGNVSGRCPECGRAVNPIADGAAFSADAPAATKRPDRPSIAERESFTSRVLRNVLPIYGLGSVCCCALLWVGWHFRIFGEATRVVEIALGGLLLVLQGAYAVYVAWGRHKSIKARPFLLLGLLLLALATLLLLLLLMLGRVFDSVLGS